MGRITDTLNRRITSRGTDRVMEAVLALSAGLILLVSSGVAVAAAWYHGFVGRELWLQGGPLAGVGILLSGMGLTGLRRRGRRYGEAATLSGSEGDWPPSDPTGVPVRPSGPEPELEAVAARRTGDEEDG